MNISNTVRLKISSVFRMTIAENLLSKLRKLKDASIEDDVDLPQYIQCWDDINQILGIMGSVFRFVKSDVEDKGNTQNKRRILDVHIFRIPSIFRITSSQQICFIK